MTVPPENPELGDDIPDEPDDVADLVPDGDLAAQNESAWPDDEDPDIVPDGDRVVPDLDEG
jgi:hypothetical protein